MGGEVQETANGPVGLVQERSPVTDVWVLFVSVFFYCEEKENVKGECGLTEGSSALFSLEDLFSVLSDVLL